MATPAGQKLKKPADGAAPALDLVPNPDILATIAAGPDRPRLVVGFAAETQDMARHAEQKRLRKGADWIVANDVSPATGIMGGAANAVTLVTAEGMESWPMLPKDEVARLLAERIARALG
jgi:phosphopantothenoylcysteine decarboxylase/phosphopantothenate--cysteine ligase